MKKRGIIVLVCLLCCVSACALAKTETIGSFTISGQEGGWKASGSTDVIITSAGTYTVSGSGSHIAIEDIKGKVNLILAGVDIDAGYGSAIRVRNTGGTTIVLRGKNILMGGGLDCGTLDNEGNPLEITCEGSGEPGHDCCKCGELFVTSQLWGAAIGSGTRSIADGGYETSGNITISGGRITAIADGIGAAIGSGMNSDCKNITISGGEVIATANSFGAAIGGGCKGDAEDIVITGGNVTAVSHGGGAGIGGGVSGNAKEIHISGGKVIAKGTTGIGGGQGDSTGGNGENIAITGGMVTAVGQRGAGIGGGAHADGRNITISGGNVDAKVSPEWYGGGAAIGGGIYGDGENITISGGTVWADANSPEESVVKEIDDKEIIRQLKEHGISLEIINLAAKATAQEVKSPSEAAAGIGGGDRGTGKNIVITGGIIEAKGAAEDADALGSGVRGEPATGIIINPDHWRIEASVSHIGFEAMETLEGSPFVDVHKDITEAIKGYQYFKTIGEVIPAASVMPPKTGDASSAALWLLLLTASGILMGLHRRRIA